MASLLSPSTINNLTIPQNPQLISNNLHLRSKKSIISCKKHTNNNENPNETPILDRRNMLIGLGGLYGSTLTLTTESPANAEPMAPEVHNSWLFASFHRWYLFFFERIMGKLINKPEFALPFWNWDHPDGMRIPKMFKDVDSPLYDPNRNIDHLSRMINLNFSRESVTFPKALDSVIKTKVMRPSKSLGRTIQEKEEEEEILVIEFDLCHANDEFVKFDVYINDPIDHSNADEDTKVTPKMAGTYTALPHRGIEMKRKCTLKLGLNIFFEEIGVVDDDAIEVALVPRSGTKCLDITAVKIDFISE